MNNKMQLEEGGYGEHFTVSKCKICGESLQEFLSDKHFCEACTEKETKPIIDDLINVKQSQDHQPYYVG